jgi:hypothetical protein
MSLHLTLLTWRSLSPGLPGPHILTLDGLLTMPQSLLPVTTLRNRLCHPPVQKEG